GRATSVSGVGGVRRGISEVDGKAPYAEIMARALSKEARERGAALLLAAGDISSEAGKMDVNDAKSYLDRFGKYRRDYFVTRGNHDRPHNTAAAAACSSVAGAP